MLYPMKFEPVFKDYLWGGNELERFNKFSDASVIAESWEVSANRDGMSIISNGELKGSSLEDVFKWFPKDLCGIGSHKQFPLLIKFIDAKLPLSVQVHPDDTYAFQYEGGSLGKSEMWYIVDAKPGARLVYGLKEGVSKEDFSKAVEEGKISDTLNYVEVKKGDWINIPAGLVHAIGEGIIVLEIQQNSNITYRVYDYDRKDAHGNTRELHIDKAMDVIDFDGDSIPISQFVKFSSKNYLEYNKYFAVEVVESKDSYTTDTDLASFHTYTVLEGSFEVEGVLVEKGETVLIPASMEEYTLRGSFFAIKSFVPDITRRFVC